MDRDPHSLFLWGLVENLMPSWSLDLHCHLLHAMPPTTLLFLISIPQSAYYYLIISFLINQVVSWPCSYLDINSIGQGLCLSCPPLYCIPVPSTVPGMWKVLNHSLLNELIKLLGPGDLEGLYGRGTVWTQYWVEFIQEERDQEKTGNRLKKRLKGPQDA